ncbi:M48 family metallopeptidase [Melioribacteraceae bacterium 4301-Me]|uniref:M48 family metallopeptidase n=1 Tax=Pyranulibacter aquaticus TaxID=3163344 RepID=UPI00359C0745
MDNNINAKKYNNIKLVVGITEAILSFILLFLFIKLGWSKYLENSIRIYFQNNYLVFLVFIVITGIVVNLIFSPFSYYTGFYLEHKYGLSNQTFYQWIWENFKSALVGGLIGLPLLLLFYFILNTFGNLWWLPFAVILFFVSVILAQVVPILILPLFYKVTPINNNDVEKRIKELSKQSGLDVKNVYQFNMSKNTKKANAAFSGLGKTKRVLLGDTLLNNYSSDEIETVIAHELGHYKHKHIIKNIAIGTFFSFVTLFLLAELYQISIAWFGFSSITQISALPVIALWGMLIALIETPISNYISRKFEYQADEYAVLVTKKKEAFLNTLNKLTNQNLADREPHPFVEWFFYSHPSIKKREKHIQKLS